LSIFGAIRSIGNPIGSLLLARGRADLGFWWNFGLFFFSPLSILFYSQWGLMGIAWGLVVNMVILQLPAYYILIEPLCGATMKEYFVLILRAFFITLIIYLISYNFFFNFENNLYKILVVSSFTILFALIFNSVLNREFIDELKGLIKR
jgi:O-antigen/teichoic acid export membrane protein